MIVIAVTAQKGGVGKTATTAAIGAGLHRAGKRVLSIDIDPQANLSAQLGAGQRVTIYDVLTDRASAESAAQETPQGAIIAADARLAERGILTGRGAEYRLRDALAPLKGKFDFCLIDTPPTLGALTISAMTAADHLLLPAKADRFSVSALQEIADTIQTVRAQTNKRLTVAGVLVTMFARRTTVNRVMLDELREQAEQLGFRVLDPPIRRAVAVEEAQLGGSVFDSRNGAAEDYQQIIDQILQITKGA